METAPSRGDGGDTTAHAVAAELAAEIMDGTLAPGTPLREVALAARFDVARNTLREALRILGGEGLVRQERNRGVRVTQLSEQDIGELFAIRELLEVSGVRAAGGRSRRELAPLRAAAQEFLRGFRERDRRLILDADRDFHGGFVAFLGLPRLSQYHARVIGELRVAMSVVYEGMRAAGEEHLEMHRLLVAGDLSACEALLRSHLETAAADVTMANRLRHAI